MPLSKDRNTVLPISKLLKVVVKPYMKLRAHVMFLFHLSGLFCTMFHYDRYPFVKRTDEFRQGKIAVKARIRRQ